MSYRSIFDVKLAAVDTQVVFDFIIPTSETLTVASTTATVYSGTDASPATLVSGGTSASGSQVTQTLVNGTAGVTYLLTCIATSDAGHNYVTEAYLAVKAIG